MLTIARLSKSFGSSVTDISALHRTFEGRALPDASASDRVFIGSIKADEKLFFFPLL